MKTVWIVAYNEESQKGWIGERIHKPRSVYHRAHSNRVAQPHFHASGQTVLKPKTQ